MEKILTIVVPTYNMENYLHHCLDSLIVPQEEMEKLEVLVINDGSKDSSSTIAHEYQDKYPDTFRVIDKENGNYGSCVNRGLKEAKGKYIKILDADDSFDKANFDRFILKLDDLDYDVILTDYEQINEKGKILYKIRLHLPSNKKLTLEEIIENYPIGFVMHCATYRVKLIKDINYMQPEGLSYTDQIWMHEPFAYIESAIYIPVSVYKYLIGRDGQTMDPKVVYKNMKSHIACALFMLERSKSFHGGYVGKEFMIRKTLHTIIAIYNAYLFEACYLNIYELIAFDKQIRIKDKDIYNQLNNTIIDRCIPYHYIREWRKHKNHRLNILIRLLYLFSKKVLERFYNRMAVWSFFRKETLHNPIKSI